MRVNQANLRRFKTSLIVLTSRNISPFTINIMTESPLKCYLKNTGLICFLERLLSFFFCCDELSFELHIFGHFYYLIHA